MADTVSESHIATTQASSAAQHRAWSGLAADAYTGLKDSVSNHRYASAACAGAGLLLAAGTLYLSRGKVAGLMEAAESSAASLGKLSARAVATTASSVEVGMASGLGIESGIGSAARMCDQVGAKLATGANELRLADAPLRANAALTFSRIEPVNDSLFAGADSQISSAARGRVSLVGPPIDTPQFPKMPNPTALDSDVLRGIDSIQFGRSLFYPRQFLVVDGTPGLWHDATVAGDKTVQSLFTGREMFYRNPSASWLGPQQRILLQHFNATTEPLNTALAREADLLMCCYPERLPSTFRARHALNDFDGKLGIAMFAEPMKDLPSGRALTVSLYRVPNLRQLPYFKP